MQRVISRAARAYTSYAAAVFLMAAGLSGSAHAATIGAGPTMLGVSTVGPGTSVATLGYSFPGTAANTPNNTFFFQPGGPPFETHSLPSYIGLAYNGTNDYYYTTGYSSLTVNGDTTNGHTGYSYLPGSGATSAATALTLATITLGAGVPSTFRLGVLSDNTGAVGDNTSIIFTGSAGSAVTVNSPTSTNTLSDDFYFVTVTNAAPGDTVTISGYNSGGGPGIGGVVFNSVPEPASLSLFAAVAVPTLLRRRKI